jgi:hypothetical protein
VLHRIVLIFALLALPVRAQNSSPSFVIDDSKPFAYIKFDHIGPRRHVAQGEASRGLYLRVVNNSSFLVQVNAHGSVDPGARIPYEVVAIERPSTRLGLPVAPERPPGPIPEGMRGGDAISLLTLEPGEDLLFSVGGYLYGLSALRRGNLWQHAAAGYLNAAKSFGTTIRTMSEVEPFQCLLY